MTGSFRLDKDNAVLLGLCSGIARWTGWNATLLRLALVAVTLVGGFPWTILLYGAAVCLAGRPAPKRRKAERRASPGDGRRHRSAESEGVIAGTNEALTREIEALR